MPPNCFNSAHCPNRSMSVEGVSYERHVIYLSNIGREQGGVELMTLYEGGTRLYRLDPGVILRHASYSGTALLLFEPFHNL